MKCGGSRDSRWGSEAAVSSGNCSGKTGQAKYQRVLLKISGEGFCVPGGFGIDIDKVRYIAGEIKSASKLGTQLAVVVGGGNFIRGAEMSTEGITRSTADYMGMLATVLNALALQEILEQKEVPTRVQTAIGMSDVAEPYIRRRCIRHLEKGRVVILAGGTGNPSFTTDTAAALRATEIGAEILLKATKVEGVYSEDPVEHPEATKYDELTYLDVLNNKLKIMDSAAISLCMDHSLRILVFSMRHKGTIERAVRGESMGTLIGGGAG